MKVFVADEYQQTVDQPRAISMARNTNVEAKRKRGVITMLIIHPRATTHSRLRERRPFATTIAEDSSLIFRETLPGGRSHFCPVCDTHHGGGDPGRTPQHKDIALEPEFMEIVRQEMAEVYA